MITSLIIFAITYIFIATEKVDKAIAAVLGAAAIVFFHAAPYESLLHHVDLNVIFLLLGMMAIVNILAVTGVFEWISIVIAKKAKGDGLKILVLFMLVTAVLSAFLDNVTTIILVAPITILITQILEIQTIPVLILEAIFSNIGGTATLVGDPPNVLIGSQTHLGFNDFLLNLGPVVLVILVVTLILAIPFFRKSFKVKANCKSRIMKANPDKAIIEPVILKRALPVFGAVIIGFFLSHTLHIEPGIIALAGALVMALVCRVDLHHIVEKVEWTTILFFIGLFMLIGALEINGVFELMGQKIVELTQGNLLLTAIAILWFCALFSAIVDNIPLVIGMIPLIKSIVPVFALQMGIEGMPAQIHTQITEPLFWALALGACLGGNGSLIGASANVIVAQIAKRNKQRLSFWDFTRYGFPIMVMSLAVSTVYIYLRFFAFRH